ncbi:MAG: DUF2764 family protein [Parachlamydiaceae bacterium]|nr:DUF2764 family protein [Parachlamydiaceae bacterium]
MANYYYVGTYLPSLSFDLAPEITLARLELLLQDNLTPADYEKTKILRRFYDILNLRSLWLGEEFDPFGEMKIFEIGEALISNQGLPAYVYEFIESNPLKEDRIRHFPFLVTKFFQSGKEIRDPFLRHYLNFERELRLVMTALRAKKLNRNLAEELQFEDPEEAFIAELFAIKDFKAEDLPDNYKEIKVIFDKYGDEPLALQKAIDEYRFNKIDQLVELSDTFSIERILAYLAQFIIVQKWFELDNDKGIRMVETLVKDIA